MDIKKNTKSSIKYQKFSPISLTTEDRLNLLANIIIDRIIDNKLNVLKKVKY